MNSKLANTQYRFDSQSEPAAGVQRRYCELRFDGDRTLSGVVMEYGDTAEMPWGDKERFEPGAFGNVSSLDVILNVQHQRDRMIGRTGGGGLTLDDSGSVLKMSATLPNTQDANDVIELIKTRVLRGLSVEFIPVSWCTEDDVLIISKADLKGLGVVDRPAYGKSRLKPRSEDEMTKTEIQELVRSTAETAINKAIEKATDGKSSDPIDAATLARSISETLGPAFAEQTTEQIKSVLKERDTADQARKDAEEKTKLAEAKVVEDRAKLDAKVESRTNLLLMVRDLLPKDTDINGKSEKDLLVLAAGKEVPEAEKRSEDYLIAKVEEIVKRRADAAKGQRNQAGIGQNSTADSAANGGEVNIHHMIEKRRATG